MLEVLPKSGFGGINRGQMTLGQSLAGELTLSCVRPTVDGWPLCG